jgi:hypothetical protein
VRYFTTTGIPAVGDRVSESMFGLLHSVEFLSWQKPEGYSLLPYPKPDS